MTALFLNMFGQMLSASLTVLAFEEFGGLVVAAGQLLAALPFAFRRGEHTPTRTLEAA